MAEVRWIKIVTDIFDDEKILLIESMPDADAIITIWFKLLCLAGKQNNHGVFVINESIPFTDEMFATIFRRKVTTVRMALEIFEKFGMVSIINGVVTIPNWEKHQSLDALERKREYDRERQRKKREEQKLLCSSNDCQTTNRTTRSTTNTTTVALQNRIDKIREDKNINNGHSTIEQDKPVRVSVDQEFERIWKDYPKKQGHKEAKAAFERSIKHGAKIEDIEKGVLRYKEHIEKCNIEMQYVKQGSTYFRQEAWNDVYDDSAQKTESYAGYNIDMFEDFCLSNK